MPQTKESWTRIGIVSVIACVLAGLSFGLIRALVLSGAERFIAFIFSVWLIGCVFSFAFDKLARRDYLIILTTVVVLVFLAGSCLPGVMRGSVCAAFSSVVTDLKP